MSASDQAYLLYVDPDPLIASVVPPIAKTAKHSRLHIIAMRLNAGIHPLNHARLAYNGETCGSCSHRRAYTTTKTFWKCNQVKMTHGPGTDIRLKWPACVRWCPGASQ